MKNKWDKAKLREQYEKMTLQDMGEYYGVTRERIRQVMNELGLKTTRRRARLHPCTNRKNGYCSLSDYLARHKVRGKGDRLSGARRFLPDVVYCAECGTATSGNKRHIHHIRYPATSEDDIQVLCASCHAMKHRGKTNYAKQLDIYTDYVSGMVGRELALKYDVSYPLVYKIINKFKNGYHTLRK